VIQRIHTRSSSCCTWGRREPGVCLTSMDRYPNMSVEFGAVSASWAASLAPRGNSSTSIRTAFCCTDACPRSGYAAADFCEHLYEIYYRFLETEDEYFDYAPAKKPPQGRWRISGLALRCGAA